MNESKKDAGTAKFDSTRLRAKAQLFFISLRLFVHAIYGVKMIKDDKKRTTNRVLSDF